MLFSCLPACKAAGPLLRGRANNSTVCHSTVIFLPFWLEPICYDPCLFLSNLLGVRIPPEMDYLQEIILNIFASSVLNLSWRLSNDPSWVWLRLDRSSRAKTSWYSILPVELTYNIILLQASHTYSLTLFYSLSFTFSNCSFYFLILFMMLWSEREPFLNLSHFQTIINFFPILIY